VAEADVSSHAMTRTNPRRTWITFGLVSAVVLALAPSTRGQGSGAQAFTGATLIDGTGSRIDNAVLVIRDGRVVSAGRSGAVSIPKEARQIPLAGKFVIPGLISAHVHVSDVQGLAPRAYTDENTRRQLGVFARYGITTVLSLGGEQRPAFAARDAQGTATLDRSRIYVSGEVVTGKTPEQARQMVASVADGKPDIIKIRVDDNLGASPKMTPEVYRAVIDEAHRRGLRVAAHIFYLEDAKDLLRAGVDMIAHSVRDKDLDDEFIGMMKARNVPYCPTLTREISTFVYESSPAFFADPFFLREADRAVVAQLQEPARQTAMINSKSAQAYKAALPIARRNLKRAAAAGLLIAMGTDAGPSPERFQGYFEHIEMEMMAEDGLSAARVLRAATSDAARALKLDDIGTLKAGAWGDFVVLDRDPLQDIRNTRTISGVWIAGNAVKR
jgi:imidazolonepropionase-like amidohydrolase